MERLTDSYSRIEMMVISASQAKVRPRYPHLWRESDKACDPMLLVRIVAATITYLDHVPEGLKSAEEAAARGAEEGERVNDRVQDVLDQVDLYFADPSPGDDYKIETVESEEYFIDLAATIGEVRGLVDEVRARGVITIDEFFRDALDEGGRNHAYTFVRALRAAGDLPPLQVQKGTTVVLDRVEFERFARQRFACSNLGCFCEDDAMPTAWKDVLDCVEDGRIAVHVRYEESLVSRTMRAVFFYDRPSKIADMEHYLDGHRDYDGGFEMRS
jgi:hypothetical protein